MTDPDEPVPPWALQTPTRSYEWWLPPALVVASALLLGVVVVALPGHVLGRVAMTTAAVGGLVGAVFLAIAGRTAYTELTYDASWRFHRARVFVGLGMLTLIALCALAVGFVALVVPGAAVALTSRRWIRRDRLRLDVQIAIVVELIVAAACIAAALCGFLVPGVPSAVSAAWISSSVLLPFLAWSLLLDRRALRSAQDR